MHDPSSRTELQRKVKPEFSEALINLRAIKDTWSTGGSLRLVILEQRNGSSESKLENILNIRKQEPSKDIHRE